ACAPAAPAHAAARVRHPRRAARAFCRRGGCGPPRRAAAVTSRRSPPSATVRVAAGQGFWGDWLEAPYRQVTGGAIDYLMMDYLAEVTMSILQKQKARDPTLGYAKDFVPLMERILPRLVERRIKVTANAGGVNPRACADAVAEAARRLGLAGKLRLGVVTGDDLLGRRDGKRSADLANVGYPIVEARPDGGFDITKHDGTGGRITVAGVTEQLVYEMGDPAEYITPDCIADFTTIRLAQAGKDRVRVSGVR